MASTAGAALTAEDLAKHTSEEDCWITIHGKVYNVTEYLMDHPGGMDVMMEHAGTPMPAHGLTYTQSQCGWHRTTMCTAHVPHAAIAHAAVVYIQACDLISTCAVATNGIKPRACHCAVAQTAASSRQCMRQLFASCPILHLFTQLAFHAHPVIQLAKL